MAMNGDLPFDWWFLPSASITYWRTPVKSHTDGLVLPDSLCNSSAVGFMNQPGTWKCCRRLKSRNKFSWLWKKEIEAGIMWVHGAIIKIRLGWLINLEQDCGRTKEKKKKHLFQDGLNEWERLTRTAMIYGLLIIHHGYKTLLIG